MKLFSSSIEARCGMGKITRTPFVIAESENDARQKIDKYIRADRKLSTAQIKAVVLVEEAVIL